MYNLTPDPDAAARVQAASEAMQAGPEVAILHDFINMTVDAAPHTKVKWHAIELCAASEMLAQALKARGTGWQDWMVMLPAVAKTLRDAADIFERVHNERVQ
jgi:hypothetical protein